MDVYPPPVERIMKRLYRSLRESDRRRYAAIEAAKIARLKQEYLSAGHPVLSVDTKKKKLLGNFYRDGW